MRHSTIIHFVAVLGLATGGFPRGKPARPEGDKPKVRMETVKGGVQHSQDDWTLITGKVKVTNGYTIVFENGAKAEVADGIALDRKGVIGDKEYPAGQEAAEFLRKLIGDREVTLYVNGTAEEYRKGKAAGKCYIGSVNLTFEVISNGWGFASHSSMVPAEIMARENKRGLWRGKLLPPGR